LLVYAFSRQNKNYWERSLAAHAEREGRGSKLGIDSKDGGSRTPIK